MKKINWKEVFPPLVIYPSIIIGLIVAFFNSSNFIYTFIGTFAIVFGYLSLTKELDGLRSDINEIKKKIAEK